MASVFLQCTMSAGFDVHIRKDIKGSPVAQTAKVIHIAGGANVRDKNSIYTPVGAMTEVSEEDFELLKKDPTFAQMLKDKFIVAKGDNRLDVSGNNPKDKSAQRTDDDFKKERAGRESPAPTTDPISPDA